jgi:hypothetical protein
MIVACFDFLGNSRLAGSVDDEKIGDTARKAKGK